MACSTAWHESGHCVCALALDGEVDGATVHPDGRGASMILMTHLAVVERGAVILAGPEAATMFAGVSAFAAYGRPAATDRANLAALRLSVGQELAAFDLCRDVLRRNAEAVRVLAERLRPGVLLGEREILNAVAGRVVYFTGVIR